MRAALGVGTRSSQVEADFWVVLYRYVSAAAREGVPEVRQQFLLLKQALRRYRELSVAEAAAPVLETLASFPAVLAVERAREQLSALVQVRADRGGGSS